MTIKEIYMDLFNHKESQTGTEVEKTTTTVAEEKVAPTFEGKSYTFRTQRYKAEDRPCVINENGRAIALDGPLAMSIVSSVSRAASLFNDVSELDDQVKYALTRVMPSLHDGVVPEGTVTQANADEAKKVRTELNKLWNDLETERKSGRSVIEGPYKYIDGIYKDKTSLLVNAIAALKKQIDKVDNAENEKKKAAIRETIITKAGDYNKDLPALLEKYEALYNKVWQDKFLNKTTSDTKMQEEIMKSLGDIASDLKVIENESDNDNLRATYYETGNLSDALKRRQQVEEAKRFASELRRKSHPVEPTPEPEPEPEKISVPEEPKVDAPSRAPEKPQVTLTDFGPGKDQYFHCWNANPAEFTGLIAYMKEHGFRCEGIKKIVDYYKES